MLTSVVKIQVSRLMSQTYLTIHITLWYLLVAQLCVWSINIRKNGQKLFYLFIYGIIHWFEECSFGVVYVTQYFSFDIPYNAQIPII